MADPVVQQLKVLPVQLGLALLCSVLYSWYFDVAWQALGYGVGVGLGYSLMLYVSVYTANRIGRHSPQQSVIVLALAAVVRFILTAILLAIGFKTWSNEPVALMLPFVIILLAPLLLVPFKKRLTD